MFILSFSVYANSIVLKITTTKGTIVNREVDVSINEITFFDSDSQKYSISNISGLGQLPNLESITFYNISNILDYAFLAEASGIKKLYMASCSVSSLMFLRSLTNLKYLHLDLYIRNESLSNILEERVSFALHKKIEFIKFSTNGIIRVPPFFELTTKPYIDLRNNNISRLKEDEIMLLLQYSLISLKYNPIVNNSYEKDKLKEIHIQFDDTISLPEKIIAIYHDFE
jgi:hypothetical protein